MLKLAIAGAMALALMSNSETPSPETSNDIAVPSPFRASFEVVPKIECTGARGSGVRISDDIVITATHVASRGPCGIGGIPAEIAFNQPYRDFTAFRVKLGRGFRATYSCDGVRAGQQYLAAGYAHGGQPTMEPLLGTNQKYKDGSVMLRGKVYSGMSGGGLFTNEGALVGIVVMKHDEADWAYIIPLTETYLCRV